MQCTIVGNHSKYLEDVRKTYDLFEQNGITVLSPRKSDIEDMDAYIRLELESKEMSKPGQLTEGAQYLLDALLGDIRQSDFVYVSNILNCFSATETFAAGYAHALEKAVFSCSRVENPPGGAYVRVLSPQEVIDFLKARQLTASHG